MSKSRICGICAEPFVPDKYHPGQIYCSSPSCQKERRKRYMEGYNKVWRKNHREYWKRKKRHK